jgi:hypothetical protein
MGVDVDQPLSPCAEMKEKWSYTSIPNSGLHGLYNVIFYNNNNNNNNNEEEEEKKKKKKKKKKRIKEMLSLFVAQKLNNFEISPATLFHVGHTCVFAICSFLRELKYILSACNGYNKLSK